MTYKHWCTFIYGILRYQLFCCLVSITYFNDQCENEGVAKVGGENKKKKKIVDIRAAKTFIKKTEREIFIVVDNK